MLFYQQLHRYMKKWPLSSSSTKTAIGKLKDQKRAEQRRDKLIQVHTQRLALLQRAQVEKDKLLEEHLITSEELHQSISDIDKEQISISKKKKKKILVENPGEYKKEVT